MNKYTVVSTLKVRTPSGVRELKSGDVVALPDDMAGPLMDKGRVRPLSELKELIPYIADDYACPKCGKHLEVFYPEGRPYDGLCWGCIKH